MTVVSRAMGGLAVLAVFWFAIGLFLLLAPDRVFKSGRPMTRRYGALGCFLFGAFCVIALVAG
jgi:hypothetical protein